MSTPPQLRVRTLFQMKTPEGQIYYLDKQTNQKLNQYPPDAIVVSEETKQIIYRPPQMMQQNPQNPAQRNIPPQNFHPAPGQQPPNQQQRPYPPNQVGNRPPPQYRPGPPPNGQFRPGPQGQPPPNYPNRPGPPQQNMQNLPPPQGYHPPPNRPNAPNQQPMPNAPNRPPNGPPFQPNGPNRPNYPNQQPVPNGQNRPIPPNMQGRPGQAIPNQPHGQLPPGTRPGPMHPQPGQPINYNPQYQGRGPPNQSMPQRPPSAQGQHPPNQQGTRPPYNSHAPPNSPPNSMHPPNTSQQSHPQIAPTSNTDQTSQSFSSSQPPQHNPTNQNQVPQFSRSAGSIPMRIANPNQRRTSQIPQVRNGIVSNAQNTKRRTSGAEPALQKSMIKMSSSASLISGNPSLSTVSSDNEKRSLSKVSSENDKSAKQESEDNALSSLTSSNDSFQNEQSDKSKSDDNNEKERVQESNHEEIKPTFQSSFTSTENATTATFLDHQSNDQFSHGQIIISTPSCDNLHSEDSSNISQEQNISPPQSTPIQHDAYQIHNAPLPPQSVPLPTNQPPIPPTNPPLPPSSVPLPSDQPPIPPTNPPLPPSSVPLPSDQPPIPPTNPPLPQSSSPLPPQIVPLPSDKPPQHHNHHQRHRQTLIPPKPAPLSASSQNSQLISHEDAPIPPQNVPLPSDHPLEPSNSAPIPPQNPPLPANKPFDSFSSFGSSPTYLESDSKYAKRNRKPSIRAQNVPEVYYIDEPVLLAEPTFPRSITEFFDYTPLEIDNILYFPPKQSYFASIQETKEAYKAAITQAQSQPNRPKNPELFSDDVDPGVTYAPIDISHKRKIGLRERMCMIMNIKNTISKEDFLTILTGTYSFVRFGETNFRPFNGGGKFKKIAVTALAQFDPTPLYKPLLKSSPKEKKDIVALISTSILSGDMSKLYDLVRVNEDLIDETYAQLIKYTTNCPTIEQELKIWKSFLIVGCNYMPTIIIKFQVLAHLYVNGFNNKINAIRYIARFIFIRMNNLFALTSSKIDCTPDDILYAPYYAFYSLIMFNTNLYEIMWSQRRSFPDLPIALPLYLMVRSLIHLQIFDTNNFVAQYHQANKEELDTILQKILENLPYDLHYLEHIEKDESLDPSLKLSAIIHSLKYWLGSLIIPIIPTEFTDPTVEKVGLREYPKIASSIPTTNLRHLGFLVGFFKELTAHASQTGVDANTIAEEFAPPLFIRNHNVFLLTKENRETLEKHAIGFIASSIKQLNTAKFYPINPLYLTVAPE